MNIYAHRKRQLAGQHLAPLTNQVTSCRAGQSGQWRSERENIAKLQEKGRTGQANGQEQLNKGSGGAVQTISEQSVVGSVNRAGGLKRPPAAETRVPEVGLEPGSSPWISATPPKTSSIRPSPAPVRPDPKPRVCTLCTPSFGSLRRSQPGCLYGGPGEGRFRSNMRSTLPEPDRPRTSTALRGGPHAGNRRRSWRRVTPFRAFHGEEGSNLHDLPTGRPSRKRARTTNGAAEPTAASDFSPANWVLD